MTADPECGIPEEELSELYAALGDNLKAREILWRLEQGARGVHLACDDLHAAIQAQHPLVYREPLVQEVIGAANAPVSPYWADRVSLAARKLAEWKP